MAISGPSSKGRKQTRPNQGTKAPKPTTPKHTASAPSTTSPGSKQRKESRGTTSDSSQLSSEAGEKEPEVSERVSQLQSGLEENYSATDSRQEPGFWNKAGNIAIGLGQASKEAINFVGDAFGGGIKRAGDIAGDVAEVAADTTGSLTAGALRGVGAEQLADRVKNASSTVGDLANNTLDSGAEVYGDYTRGVVSGAGELVEGVGQAIGNPAGVVEGVKAVYQDPSLLLEGYKKAFKEEGNAFGVGRIAFDVGSSVLGGGPKTVAGAKTLGNKTISALRKPHPFKGDLYDPEARYQVYSEGFPNDPDYLKAQREASQDLVRENPSGLGDALFTLQDGPLARFYEQNPSGAPEGSFLKPRLKETDYLQTRLTDGEGRLNRYGSAGNKKSVWKRFKKLKKSAPLPEIGHYATAEINGERFSLTQSGGSVWNHSNLTPEKRETVMKHMDELYKAARNPELSLDKTVEKVGEFNWWFAQTTPFERGSASAAEAITKSIFDSRGIDVSVWKQGVSPDLEAFVTPLEEYVSGYSSLFEAPPKWRGSNQ